LSIETASLSRPIDLVHELAVVVQPHVEHLDRARSACPVKIVGRGAQPRHRVHARAEVAPVHDSFRVCDSSLSTVDSSASPVEPVKEKPVPDESVSRPPVVSIEEWQRQRADLLGAQKEATRVLDALAARRRRLAMVKFDNSYGFDTPASPKTLLDLFDGREQLVVYQFMDNGPDAYCPGCTHFTSNVADLDSLRETGVTFVTVSNMPLDQIERNKTQKGWRVPFVSSRGNGFADATGAGNLFSLTVFLRNRDDIYLTSSTTARGVDRLLFFQQHSGPHPYGRQQDWEDSPPGWPQHPTYG
jgi:predicted dithiol-disulfide oxidoreductase (DUF899 family)